MVDGKNLPQNQSYTALEHPLAQRSGKFELEASKSLENVRPTVEATRRGLHLSGTS